MLEIIAADELEMLIRREKISLPKEAPVWIAVVRTYPCMRKTCGITPAGTAHHVYVEGIALRCDDRLTIPLCIDCHVIGMNPVQEMNDEEFENAIGFNKDDAVRRMYELIMDNYNNGNIY